MEKEGNHIKGGCYQTDNNFMVKQSQLLNSPFSGATCRGTAPVDPGWFEGGDGVVVLEKTYLITDIEGD